MSGIGMGSREGTEGFLGGLRGVRGREGPFWKLVGGSARGDTRRHNERSRQQRCRAAMTRGGSMTKVFGGEVATRR
jgi:hypothetical protein